MLKSVEKFIEKNNIIKSGDKIVMGISGGADSVCLLYIMLELSEKYSTQLFAVHINHGVRGKESDEDEIFTKALCNKHKIPFYSQKVNIRELSKELKMSEEEAGRYIRYNVFNETCKRFGANKIAVAHNLDDQAETVLLNLIRGSGLKGLCGMHPIRENIIRPLLCVKREVIELYLKDRNIEFCTDKSNSSDKFTRNKIRLNVLPFVEQEINNKVKENITRNANILRETDIFIEKITKNAYNKIITQEGSIYRVNIAELKEEDIVIQRGIIRKIIFNISDKLKDITAEHIEQVILLANSQTGKRINLPYAITVIKSYNNLELFKKEKCIKNEWEGMDITVPSSVYCDLIGKNVDFRVINYNKNILISESMYTKHLDYDKIKCGIRMRTRREGDYIEINTGRKKLKKYFIDEKIPKEEREQIILIADGSHILWIVGYRISEDYKVTDSTKKILEIKITGDEYV